jgi:itaconate CoA-transferase
LGYGQTGEPRGGEAAHLRCRQASSFSRRQHSNLCRGQPAHLQRAERSELRVLIVQAFAELTAQEVVARLDQAGIANAQVNVMAQVWEHAQLRARRRWVQVDTPRGPVPAALPPGARTANEVRMGAVPALGEHSDTILAELGYTASQVSELRRDGAL